MFMKRFFLILFQIGACFGFLSYPYDAGSLVSSFLASLHYQPHRVSLDITTRNLTPGALCSRRCTPNDYRICHFEFTLEFYQVAGGACDNCMRGNSSDCFNHQCVTGDGVERTFMSVDRQLPGPPILVCQHDIIVVDVENQMEGTATSIHWHGLLQHDSPFADGVPFLTQCPIVFSTSFRYFMRASQVGTHLYHSHAGQHKANGVYGAVVIRELENGQNRELWDRDLEDFYVLCSDWMHVHAEEFFPGLPSRISLYESILINGRGQYYNKTSKTHLQSPLTIYSVHHNHRYLFRVINAASNVCPFQLQIDSHNFTIVAADSNKITPVTVEKLFFNSGERFDIVLRTHAKATRDYLMHVRALSPCNETVEQFAVIRYVNEKEAEGVSGGFFSGSLPVSDETPVVGSEMLKMSSNEWKKDIVNAKPDLSFSLYFATPQLDNRELFESKSRMRFMVTSDRLNNNNIGTINNISLVLPHFPLLARRHDINETIFCNATHKDHAKRVGNLRECVHRIKVPLNSIVEFLLIDIDDHSRHPFHLHGHKFYVTEMGKFDEPAIAKITPLLKDTVTIPSNGFVRVKFRANNAGFWLAHCHFDYHLAVGMGFVLQVGEIHEMAEAPEGLRDNCGQFMPKRFRIT